MERITAGKAIAGVATAMVLLAACGNGDPEVGVSNDPEDVSGDVVFWTYPLSTLEKTDWWEEHVEKFQDEYPNVNVDVVMQSFQGREEALVTAISGGNAPDVVYFNPDFIPKYADEDVLLPLDDLRDDWDAFADSSLEAMTWEDTLYGAPLLMQYQNPYCDTEILEAADVECPTTWDELRDFAPQVKDAGYYATEYNGTSTLNHSFYIYLWQAGGEVLNEDQTEAAFNGPEGLEAMEFIKEMVDEEWVPRENLSVDETLEQSERGQGNVGYINGADPDLGKTRQILDPDRIQTIEPMSNVEQVASGSVGGWSVLNTSDSPEAAQAWVKYLSEAEFIEDFITETGGYLPPREDVVDVYQDDTQMADAMDYVDDVRVGVMHPQSREIIDTIRPHIQDVLLEGADPQEALDAAAQEVNALL